MPGRARNFLSRFSLSTFFSLKESGVILVFTVAFSLSSFGCSSVINPETESRPAAYAPEAHPGVVRILTINIWSGLDYNGLIKMGHYGDDDPERRYRMLVSGIRRLDPDVIAVQEANPLPRYAERLASDLGYDAVWRVSDGGFRFGDVGFPVNLRQGEVILVKKPWKLEDLGERQLSGSVVCTNWFCAQAGEIRKAMLVRAVIGGKPLYIYGVHLHAGLFYGPTLDKSVEMLRAKASAARIAEEVRGAEKDIARRRHEVAGLKKFIDETLPQDAPAILLGCFNTDTGSGDLDPLISDGSWIDTFRLVNPEKTGYTWDPAHDPNFHPAGPARFCDRLCTYQEEMPMRLDFIFINREIPKESVINSRVVFKPISGMAVSDHYGVMTEVRW